MSGHAGSVVTIGALPGRDGTRFRVWAPHASRVEVLLEGRAPAAVPLAAREGGYFDAFVPGVRPGARYRYRLDGGDAFPDPASRSQPAGVHGPSEVVDPDAFAWRDSEWAGIPPEALVIYEVHTGAFTPEGTFDGILTRLDQLVALGVTAVEVMPIADFPGERNWGYDGVNLFAPARVYGGIEGFKRLVDGCHRRGLAVILDVVYNHLGPEGNYIPAVTGGAFFTDRHHTPWGQAVNVDGPGSRAVRDFIIQNALHWLTEYHVDGLRLDATHAILDDSSTHVLAELAARVRELPGPRRILIAEDERNDRRLILPPDGGGFGLDAVWADDFHHQLRRLVAGDHEGYFAQYGGTVRDLAATLRQGWWRDGSRPGSDEHDAPAGTPADDIPPARFVHCIQNHDQVGNRAMGDRLNHDVPLAVYRAVSALLLTSPYTPLLWMGQEWAASSPFLYFTDHPDELGRLVTAGRRAEFSGFSAFHDPVQREGIPDPQAPETFLRSKLDWSEREVAPHAGVLALYTDLLRLRARNPALGGGTRDSYAVAAAGDGTLLLRRNHRSETFLVVMNVHGEADVPLTDDAATRAPDGTRWVPVLATEDPRYGGEGRWGSIEDDLLRLAMPVTLVLRAR